MLINDAFAETAAVATTAASIPAPAAAQAEGMVLWNIGFIVVMVFLFYVLLIRPQQVRFRQHDSMLKALKKGDRVVLQSGLIVTIHDYQGDKDEATVDLNDNVRVKIMRSAIAGRYEDYISQK